MTTVYVTAPESAATELATTLVEEGLAACVNRFDCRSTYRWENDVVHDQEVALVIKTTAERYEEIKARIEALHPHDVPCIERFDESDRSKPFSAWIAESVR